MVPLARGAAGCQIKRQYVPSPYENYNLELAKNLTDVEIDINRKNLFITFCRAEVDASNIWLERVRVHMETEHVPEGNDDDLKYLSRFVVTKTCTGEGQTELSTTWTEWIEPLTIHARHPFALASCRGVYTPAETRRFKFSTELQSTDYVLVQSGTSLHEQTLLRRHNHTRMEAHRNRQPIHRESHLQTHNYFFDAGTSTFESSLRWFLCAYMQVLPPILYIYIPVLRLYPNQSRHRCWYPGAYVLYRPFSGYSLAIVSNIVFNHLRYLC